MPVAPARTAALAARPVLAFVLLLAPAAGLAEPLALPAGTPRALQAIEETSARLQRARLAMEALEAHRTPAGGAAEWDGVASALQAAAEVLRRSEGPSLPDAGAYALPVATLQACATRPGALARLDRLQRALQADLQRCAESRGLLRERLQQATGAEEARRALVGWGGRGGEEARSYFTWRWEELERPAAGALATAAAELRRWLERVERVQGELRARGAAFSGWQAEYGRARDCVLAGAWVGARTTREGSISALALELAPAGGGWSGTVTVDGTALPVQKASLRGNVVSLQAGAGQATLRGTLSADERVLKGTLSSMDGPSSFTLTRR